MSVLDEMNAMHATMLEWRHDFHAHPELSLAEMRTSRQVQHLLNAFGVDEVHCGLAETGVVGVIRGNRPGGGIGLRADMDALPILEATGLSHASRNAGVMHACGHDGHMAMLLGAAAYLAKTRDFPGTVYAIFQPAEEDRDGADLMVRDGLFDKFPMSRIFGLHNWPSHPCGQFFWRDGPIMAAAANIDITIRGKGAHAAHPDRGINPVLASAHVITELHSLITREIDPVEGGILSMCQIEGGKTYNVIPDAVRLKGSARWFSDEAGRNLREGVERISKGVALAFGATAEIAFQQTCIATVNEPQATAVTRVAAKAVAGENAVHYLEKPSLGAEDFSTMLRHKAGSYIILGAGEGPLVPQLHNPLYDFNDRILPIGAAYWATLAKQALS